MAQFLLAAAGIPVTDVVYASVPLVITMGIVTTIVAFFLLRRDMKRGALEMVGTFDGEKEIKKLKMAYYQKDKNNFLRFLFQLHSY
ncbi:Transporter OS=Ureibacillus acetophenoni OX=614649 GN=SAMN05877842_103133 PE=4 SV=1 [Ureibacillus acetophenoni]